MYSHKLLTPLESIRWNYNNPSDTSKSNRSIREVRKRIGEREPPAYIRSPRCPGRRLIEIFFSAPVQHNVGQARSGPMAG